MGTLETSGNLLFRLVQAYADRKANLFRNHVEPLQNHVLQIHDDYVRGFTQLRDHLRRRTMPPQEVVGFLKDRRRDLDARRDLVSNLSAGLAQAKKRGISLSVWEVLSEYCDAVLSYLESSGGMAAVSWYSGFIEDIELNIRLQQEYPDSRRHRNAWDPTGIAGDPAGDLLNNAETTLDLYLPKALSRVNQAYARLRAMMV